MVIKAIFSKATKEILYSRSRHDCRMSEDGKTGIDGGFDRIRILGNFEDYIMLDLDGDKLLKMILQNDYSYGNKNASQYKEGYHGRFKIVENSNPKFYKELVLNYNEIKEYFPCDN